MSAYWFQYLSDQLPWLKTHFLNTALPKQLQDTLPAALQAELRPRSMQVQRLRVLPLESIVRGHLTGSAWLEYRSRGTVHSISMPEGLIEGQQLPTPLWTPSTKAAPGEKDQNISPAKAAEIVGEAYAKQIESISVAVYEAAARRAADVGIMLADTKLEFRVEPGAGTGAAVVLVDEVLTPDSSRFWSRDTWRAHLGGPQPSFDKQHLRDWLSGQGLKGRENVVLLDEIVSTTAAKYREAYERITGQSWKGA